MFTVSSGMPGYDWRLREPVVGANGETFVPNSHEAKVLAFFSRNKHRSFSQQNMIEGIHDACPPFYIHYLTSSMSSLAHYLEAPSETYEGYRLYRPGQGYIFTDFVPRSFFPNVADGFQALIGLESSIYSAVVRCDGQVEFLSDLELKFLHALATRRNATVPNHQLIRAIWGDNVYDETNLRGLVHRVKKKLQLDADTNQAVRIEASRRTGGYRLIVDDVLIEALAAQTECRE